MSQTQSKEFKVFDLLSSAVLLLTQEGEVIYRNKKVSDELSAGSPPIQLKPFIERIIDSFPGLLKETGAGLTKEEVRFDFSPSNSFTLSVQPFESKQGTLVLLNFQLIHSPVELTREAEMFKGLFSNAGNGIVIISHDGKILKTNLSFAKMLGYTKKELEGNMDVFEITHPDDIESTSERLAKLQRGEKRKTKAEKRYIRKNGQAIWVVISNSVIRDPESGELIIAGIINDISKSKEAFQQLQESELKFRSVFEETGHGVAILDEFGNFVVTNKKFRDLLGISLLSIKRGASPREYIHSDFINEYSHLIASFSDRGNSKYEGEGKFVHKSGKEIDVRLNVSTYEDPILKKVRMVLIIEDITDRKSAIYKLQISEAHQRGTIDALSGGLIVIDKDGWITQTNRLWTGIIKKFDALSNAVKGANFLDIINTDKLGYLLNGLEPLTSGASSFFEIEVRLGTTEESWFLLRASILHDMEGIVITWQDITVRKRVERALEESLSNYRNIYNITPVMMHSIDSSGRLVSVSNYWLEKLGYKRHEVIGKNLRDFLTEESKIDADIILPVFFEKGSIFDVSYDFVTKSGEVLETLLSAIEEGKGTRSARSLAVVNDITPLKRAERQLKKNRSQLIEAQRIAKLGNFELDFKNKLLHTSAVFDEIMEFSELTEKSFSLLPLVVPNQDLQTLYTLFEKLLKTGEHLEYTGRAITLKSRNVIWLECLGRPVMEDGEIVKMVGTIQDISKSKKAEVEVKRLSERLSLALEGANIGVWEQDFRTGEVLYENIMYDLFGLQKVPYQDAWVEILKQAVDEDHEELAGVIGKFGKEKSLIDHVFRAYVTGEIRYFRSMTRPVLDENDEVTNLVGVIMDITKDRELLNQLEVSLREKDILIKEVHHRVKNNMQMISSILALKALDLTDADSKSIFDECTLRIKSMAVVHDQLYRFYNVSEIDIERYLEHLLSGLNALLVGVGGDYRISINSESMLMNVDTALLCGLIVSEIVANAFKHGFKDKPSGEVVVSFVQEGENKILSITNDGEKIPDDLLSRRTASLGLSLIKTFTGQLSGKLSLHPDNGFVISF